MNQRVTGYRYEGGFSEAVLEPILERARQAGIVTEYDTGRGRIVWFNGYPGKGLREVRRKVLAQIASPRALR